MAAAIINSSGCTFTLFSKLPPELRNQIWRDVLPGKVGTVLFSYKKGSWDIRDPTEVDEEYGHENNGANLNLIWKHDLLDEIQFEIPLVYANREARGIALDWIREQGLQICSLEDRQQPVFVRRWDPVRDALYVGLDQWSDFLNDPHDRFFQPEFLNRNITVEAHIWHLAVPLALLKTEHGLSTMFGWFDQMRVLYVIVNPQPAFPVTKNNNRRQWRWEFEDPKRGVFVYNKERGDFDFVVEDGESQDEERLYTLLEDFIIELKGTLQVNQSSNFQIRPIFARRK
jgi:hypothetical protein